MNKHFEEMKRDIAENMTPVEFNQFVVWYAMSIHNKCMEHALDNNRSEYELWNAQREASVEVATHSAQAAQKWHAHINRFNTHRMPIKVRFERERMAVIS